MRSSLSVGAFLLTYSGWYHSSKSIVKMLSNLRDVLKAITSFLSATAD